MRCRSCGLFNPQEALRCDCGYDFPTGQMKESYLLGVERRAEDVDGSVARRERSAFVAAPFVAIGLWYLVTLASLAVMNGRLRARTDVLAMAIGATTIGLIVAVLATVCVAGPVYLTARRARAVSLATAVAGGALAGALLTYLGWSMEGRLWNGLLTPAHGVVVGVGTAAAWWLLAGKPNQRVPLSTRQ